MFSQVVQIFGFQVFQKIQHCGEEPLTLGKLVRREQHLLIRIGLGFALISADFVKAVELLGDKAVLVHVFDTPVVKNFFGFRVEEPVTISFQPLFRGNGIRRFPEAERFFQRDRISAAAATVTEKNFAIDAQGREVAGRAVGADPASSVRSRPVPGFMKKLFQFSHSCLPLVFSSRRRRQFLAAAAQLLYTSE